MIPVVVIDKDVNGMMRTTVTTQTEAGSIITIDGSKDIQTALAVAKARVGAEAK